MPFVMTYLEPEDVLVGRLSGRFDGAALMQLARAVVSTEGLQSTSRELWDCRDMQIDQIDFAQMNEMVTYKREHRPDAHGNVALIVHGDLLVGTSRMYQALMEDNGRDVELFESIDAAAEWLGLTAVPPEFATH